MGTELALENAVALSLGTCPHNGGHDVFGSVRYALNLAGGAATTALQPILLIHSASPSLLRLKVYT
jgi:hypothetical protein